MSKPDIEKLICLALDIDSSSLEGQEKQLKNDRYRQNTHSRGWLTKWAAAVVSTWLYLVLATLFRAHLSDAVLCTLLGTTTLNVLGLMFIVLRGYFNSTES